MVSDCDFDSHFLMTNDVTIFYMLVSHLYIFFGEIAIEVLFLFFSLSLFIFFVVELLDFFTFLMLEPYYIYDLNKLSPVSCLFAFLIVSLNAKNVFTLIKSNLSFFSFVVVFKDPLLNPGL